MKHLRISREDAYRVLCLHAWDPTLRTAWDARVTLEVLDREGQSEVLLSTGAKLKRSADGEFALCGYAPSGRDVDILLT